MKTKLIRIHVGLGLPEIGVQFDTLDDADQKTSTQRAFVVVSDAVLAPLWLAAKAALDAEVANLPLDFPPSAVTTALMQRRNALAEAEVARKEKEAAIAAKAVADAARVQAEALVSTKAAEAVDLDAQIAAKRAALAAMTAEPTR